VTSGAVASERRYTGGRRCPICGHHAGERRGTGTRCSGYETEDRAVAFCQRVASGKQTADGLHRHWMYGPCDCGTTHAPWDDASPELRAKREKAKAKANGSARPNGACTPKPPAAWTVPDEHVETFHPYEDPASGALLFELARFLREHRERYGAKAKPRHRIGDRWYLGAGPWAGRSDDLPLYRQREAVAELVQGGTAYIADGERDADTIYDRGNVAVCNAWGSGKFRDSHAATLAAAVAEGEPSAALVVVVDQDAAGRRHAADVLRKLRAAGVPREKIRTVKPAVGKDSADHFDAGHRIEDFEPCDVDEDPRDDAESASKPTPETLGFSGEKLLALLERPRPEPIEAGRPVDGHLSAWIAPAITGKTSLALWSGMARAAGVAPWDDAEARPAGRVLIYSLDEAPEQVARRMHGLATFHPAGPLRHYAERITVIGPDRETDPEALDGLRFGTEGLATLGRWLTDAEQAGEPFAEVYVDAYADVIPVGASENNNESATAIGGALERLAVHHGCAVVLLHHAGKPRADATGPTDVRFLARGASALAAKARCVVSVEIVDAMPHLRRLRTATNLGPTPGSALFAVADPDGAAEELLFWKPTDEPLDAVDPRELLATGECISTRDLARRLGGDSIPAEDEPPGELRRRAAALRERWKERGLVVVTIGTRKAKMIALADA
jgi:hypothetical protein